MHRSVDEDLCRIQCVSLFFGCWTLTAKQTMRLSILKVPGYASPQAVYHANGHLIERLRSRIVMNRICQQEAFQVGQDTSGTGSESLTLL